MSKQVKLISKSVMGVMTVGLIAMLGAKAEAHYIPTGGGGRFCQFCFEWDGRAVPHDPDAVLEGIARTRRVELRCNTGDVVVNGDKVVTFKANTKITESHIIDKKKRTAHVEIPVSHEALNQSFAKFCLDGLPPTLILIKQTSVEITAFQCKDSDLPCSDPVSTVEANCVLPKDPNGKEYNLDNLPSKGTDMDCSQFMLIKHLE